MNIKQISLVTSVIIHVVNCTASSLGSLHYMHVIIIARDVL